MQTDDDAASPEEYCRNRIASADDEENKEDEVEDEDEEDDDVEFKKIRSLQGLRCHIAPTLPYFITHPQFIARYIDTT
jgi:hypothetical protein